MPTPNAEQAREALETCDKCPDCDDRDEDCQSIEDKVACWLYAPERGMCPWLRTPQPGQEG